jgi:DNA-binding transcriptional ArsR family regulator
LVHYGFSATQIAIREVSVRAPPSGGRPAFAVGKKVSAPSLARARKWWNAMDLDALEHHSRRATTLLKAMSNEHRLVILCQLAQGEKCVGQLETVIGLSQSALSQHLARLRRDHLVKTRRSAQTIFYSLAGGEAGALIHALHDIFCKAAVPALAASRETENAAAPAP